MGFHPSCSKRFGAVALALFKEKLPASQPCPGNTPLGFRGRRHRGKAFCLGLAAAGRDRRQEQLPRSTRGPELLPPRPAVLGGPPRPPEECGQAGTTTTTGWFSSFPAFHMQD